MDKTIIISNYDMGYQWSIYKDGETYYRREHKPVEIENIYTMYDDHTNGGEVIKERFPNYTVIICDDGCIDIYERRKENEQIRID